MGESMNGETTKKRLTAPDIFIVVILALTVLALVGQSVAVYFIDRADASGTLTVSFVAASVERIDAEALSAALTASEKGIEARVGGTGIGRLAGKITLEPVIVNDVVSLHLCDMSGQLLCAGKADNGVYTVHGVGTVRVGQVLPVYMDGGLWSIEITHIAETR